MADSKRIPPDGGQDFSHNPFASLSSEGLPPAPENPPAGSTPQTAAKPAKKNRGRVDIVRVKAGRGGKTVTVVKNFVGIGLPEKEQLAKAMQKACATGGTVKDGQIEIQGGQTRGSRAHPHRSQLSPGVRGRLIYNGRNVTIQQDWLVRWCDALEARLTAARTTATHLFDATLHQILTA